MKNTKVKLIYPAQQFELTENPRPDSSLGILYLAGKLRDNNFDVSILDMLVGDETDDLKETFYRRTKIDEKHIRVGMSIDHMLTKIEKHKLIGVGSIFTPQTFNCFEVAQAIKKKYPEKILFAGGGNARALYKDFLNNGFDVVVFGEAENAVLEFVESIEKGLDYKKIKNLAFKDGDKYIVNPERPVEFDLDKLPMPAWDLLPLKKLWKIGEPHGGTFKKGQEVRYLSMQTSRGCPFNCSYCHISKEGEAKKLRLKSIERVDKEIDKIISLGAEYLFFEDDSLLAKKKRIKTIFNNLKTKKLKIVDVNGVNLAHFFTRNKETKKLDVDVELLDLMKEVGWVEIAYPFESGVQRILDFYATGKWNHKDHDMVELVQQSVKRGLKVSGFFTIGYPDESYEELTKTFLFARKMVEAGLNVAAFYIIQPYPGTELYDFAQKNGYLPKNLTYEDMKSALPTLINTKVSREVLEYCRRMVYQIVNRKGSIQKNLDKNAGVPIVENFLQ
tara:strand:- start:5306 stop:6811 length:1506 start_codon:yes stop_codon:yes gene_type:complete